MVLTWADAQDQQLSVSIEGLEDGELLQNVNAFLQINRLVQTQESDGLPGEARIRWLHRQAQTDIERALQPFGYYQPTISSDLRQENNNWTATYRIDPGPPLLISTLDIKILGEGQSDDAFQQLLKNTDLVTGQRLRHQSYEALKSSLQGLATERGYFDARLVTNQIRVDLQTYDAGIVLHYDTGERYNYREVIFDQDILATEFLQRYVDFEPGQPYYAPDLLELQSDLIDSEYFEQVTVSASPENAVDHQLPVEIHLEPRKKHKYTFGLGYGTDTGARGRIGVERRWLNRWGHHYEAQFVASQIKLGLAGEYVIPGDDPRSDSYNLRANITEEFSDVKESTTAVLGISQQQQDGKWLKITSLDYHWENFNFSDEEQTTGLLMPGLNWTYVDADPDRLNVSEGSRISFELRGGADFLLSDITFIQAAIKAKWIHSLNEKNRLILRGDVGSTYVDSGDFDRLPSSLRFFAGGDRSVRGYSLDSIGPRNEEDDVIGAKHLLVGSVEYEYRILEKWSVAAFVDSGDAFNDTPNFKTGVGVGVRWQSPVGPVRVDLASGLDEPGDTISFHLSIGPDL